MTAFCIAVISMLLFPNFIMKIPLEVTLRIVSFL